MHDWSKLLHTLTQTAGPGESITVVPPGETALTFDAAWMGAPPALAGTPTGEEETRTERALVRSTDWSQPVRGSVVTRAATGESFAVTSWRPVPATGWILTLEATDATLRTAGQYGPA